LTAVSLADRPNVRWTALFQGGYAWTSITAFTGIIVGAFDTYIVATAMPSVLRELGQPEFYAWITSAFQLATIVGLSLGGAGRDRLGLRAPFLIALVVFAGGSLACAMAPSMPLVVLARGLQGLGGGGLVVVCFSAAAGYPEGLRLRMYSLLSVAWASASLVGPILGGSITEVAGWRWVFIPNVPVCLLVALLAWFGFAGSVPGDKTRAVPVVRSLLLALATGSLVAAPSAGATGLALLLAGLVLGALYLRQEQAARVPVVPLQAWLGRGRLGSILQANLLFSMSFLGAAVFVPLFLQALRGQSAAAAGLVLTAGGLAWTGGNFLAGWSRGRWSKRMVIAGALLVAAACATIALQVVSGRWPVILVGVSWAVGGFGIGMAYITLLDQAIASSPREQYGSVTGAVQTLRTLGGALGGALMGALLHLLGAAGDMLRLSIVAIFLLATVLALWPATFGQPRMETQEAA